MLECKTDFLAFCHVDSAMKSFSKKIIICNISLIRELITSSTWVEGNFLELKLRNFLELRLEKEIA